MTNIRHFQEKLEAEMRTLIDELSKLGRASKQTGDWEATPSFQTAPEADITDTADRFEDFEERSALLNSLEARLNEVREALDKIKSGAYRKCVVCQNAIEDKRLEANPAARTCLKHLNVR